MIKKMLVRLEGKIETARGASRGRVAMSAIPFARSPFTR